MSTDVDEHLDPPTLIDVSYLRGMAVRNVDVFIKLALLHAENCEEHIAHMARFHLFFRFFVAFTGDPIT